MTAWDRGGWTGSLNRWVAREIQDQMRANAAVRRSRYPLLLRTLRAFFSMATFGRFLAAYVVLDLVFVAAEAVLAWLHPQWLPTWTLSGPSPQIDIKSLITNVTSYYIGAQVGMLGVVSIALALVTLIAQRDAASTDVQVYYHESLSFEIVASVVALLAVLCVQLIWPLQFALHRLGAGTPLQVFKLILLAIHLCWLLINLGALAHFVGTTFRFVQQSAREAMRERYTANFVLPDEMRGRLRAQMYGVLGRELSDDDDGRAGPGFLLGADLDIDGQVVEISKDFGKRVELYDVRATWVRWVFRRWARRCKEADAAGLAQAFGFGHLGPSIIIAPAMGRAVRKSAWCQRRGGVPLTWLERQILRGAFRFRSLRDEA